MTQQKDGLRSEEDVKGVMVVVVGGEQGGHGSKEAHHL